MGRKSRKEYSRKAISLFSGAGGLDLGLAQSGFDILACLEIDPNCCETLRHAAKLERRKTQVVEGDIRNVNPKQLMTSLGLGVGELDLLAGGSPCQSFSQIGKRQCLDDERGELLFEFIRFAKVLKPKVVLMEQVKGLLNAPDTTGKIGGVYELLKRKLMQLGYHVNMKVITASEFGVPQHRERVFIVASIGCEFRFPAPTHGEVPSGALPLFALKPYITAGSALDALPKPVRKGDSSSDENHIDVTPAGDQNRINGVEEGSHLAKSFHLPASQRGKLSKKDTTKYRRLSRQEPSITLRCGEIFFHPIQNRYLTPREYMRIHGYPDDYVLKGPIRSRSGRVRDLDQHRQVANSVPPPIGKLLGGCIVTFLDKLEDLNKPTMKSPVRRTAQGNG